MAQSPTIAIPKKSTDEVDWTGPIRSIIKQSYGENPDNYASECASLQRCRQDAVRGAGSDLTAASLLTKYFGQLELLELRFSEIRVSFPWRDAFTGKLTTQTSLAFEKASIIYQIAATHSSIASSQNRSDPEGLKRAYYYFRTCAGMLTYINDNFLHAPSTDLSREVVKFLVGITLAQANETFYETCIDQRKSPSLVAKVASHTSSIYNGLVEEVKEFMGKGIFDRNWVTLLQIKAKYFTSLTQYQRSLADTAAGKHGEALARMGVAEANAKEAHKISASFSPYFVTTLSTTLPPDTGTAILELTKAHMALCTEKKVQGQKDNDLIYNAPVPSEATLSQVDKIAAATPIPIQEVYGTPEVQKTIGPDLFAKLIPLSVHESASVYSEEKAKIVRAEVEKSDIAESEVKAALNSLGVKSGLGRFKEIAEGSIDDGVPATVLSWQEELKRKESQESVDSQLKALEVLKSQVRSDLGSIAKELEEESRECESMRVKFEHRWTQEPSGIPAKTIRQELKSHTTSLDAASPSDQQVHGLWESIRTDVQLLLSPQLDVAFSNVIGNSGVNLLEMEPSNDDSEREVIGKLVGEIEERLGRINKISRERNEILKDLKEKIQNDDVSHLLLLNRRNSSMEPALFANELEKFRPYQARLGATHNAQQATIQEIDELWKSLKNKGGRGKGVKKWEDREKRVAEFVRKMALAREGYLEVRDGIMKGLQFYKDLSSLTTGLQKRAHEFVVSRNRERETLGGNLALELRLDVSGSSKSSAPPPPPPPRPLESSMAAMSLGSPAAQAPPQPYAWHSSQQPTSTSPFPPPPPQNVRQSTLGASPSPYSQAPVPAAHPTYSYGNQYTSPSQTHSPPPGPTSHSPFPPPPPQPQTSSNPYADMFSTSGLSSQFSLNTPQPQPSHHYPGPPPQGQSWATTMSPHPAVPPSNNTWSNPPVTAPPSHYGQQQSISTPGAYPYPTSPYSQPGGYPYASASPPQTQANQQQPQQPGPYGFPPPPSQPLNSYQYPR